MNRPASKWIHEPFARFFEQPTRETLRPLLIESGGEQARFDFKEQWPEKTKLARHLLALANAGGGCLIVGVRETNGTFDSTGLTGIEDKTKIMNGIKSYVPEDFLGLVNIIDFAYGDAENAKLAGKNFQVALVEGPAPQVPFVAAKDGDGFRAGAIYIRRGAESSEANYSEVQALLQKRIEATSGGKQARDLREHFAELKVLYSELSPTKLVPIRLPRSAFDAMESFFARREPNPNYPLEEYEAFVYRLLNEKKKLIARLLGLDYANVEQTLRRLKSETQSAQIVDSH